MNAFWGIITIFYVFYSHFSSISNIIILSLGQLDANLEYVCRLLTTTNHHYLEETRRENMNDLTMMINVVRRQYSFKAFCQYTISFLLKRRRWEEVHFVLVTVHRDNWVAKPLSSLNEWNQIDLIMRQICMIDWRRAMLWDTTRIWNCWKCCKVKGRYVGMGLALIERRWPWDVKFCIH